MTKYSKKIILNGIKFLVFTFLIIFNFVPKLIFASDSLKIIEDRMLINQTKRNILPSYLNLTEDNYNFEGFLIVKFRIDDVKLSNNYYYMDIFWINNLVDIKNYNLRVYYNLIDENLLDYYRASPLDSTNKSNILKKFILNYVKLNKSNPQKTYLYFSYNNNINSNLFKDEKIFWQDGPIYYLIFKTKFSTAILNSSIDQGIIYNKIFIPTSNLLEFENLLDSVELENIGFTKKLIKIDFQK